MGHVLNLVPKVVRNHTPADVVIPNCIGFYAGSSGTVTATNSKGEAVSIIMTAGGVFVGRLQKITAFTGAAGTLVAYQEA